MVKKGRPRKDGQGANATAAAQMEVMLRLRHQAAAALLGWDPRKLRDSIAPRNADGSFDGPRLVQWLLEKLRKELADPIMNGPDTPSLELLRAEQHRRVKRENDEAERLLIPAAEVLRQLSEIGRVLNDRLDGLARAADPKASDEVRRAKRETHDALMAIAPPTPEQPTPGGA